MDQIIRTLSAKLGLPEVVVRQGVGILLNFLKQKAAGTEFEKFAAMLPGSADVMNAAPAEGGGGLLGGLLGAAGGLLGGQAGDLAKVVGSLQGAGISPDKAAPFAGEFFEQAKAVAGPELVSQILASVPGLSEALNKKSA
jgi:hypothetical protein